jgi:hypothetical protein
MITVNALINQCFQRCSLVGDAQSVSGTQAMQGLNDLSCLIAELNAQNLILSDVETVNIFKNGKIKIMAELPEGWSEVDELTYGTKAGQICKCGNKIYAWEPATPSDPSTLTWVERNDIVWSDLLIKPLPDRVVTLSRKLGERYIQLFPAERQVLDSKTKLGLPTFYTCETQLESVKAANTNYVFEVFYIETDSVQNIEYRITYLKSIPEYQLNDRLYFSEKIISILEDGICAKLCLRYKLLDVKPLFDEEFANGVRMLKRTNNANRPMTYEGIGGSYLDNFYNGFAPNQW